jgi:hypothetical protein
MSVVRNINLNILAAGSLGGLQRKSTKFLAPGDAPVPRNMFEEMLLPPGSLFNPL